MNTNTTVRHSDEAVNDLFLLSIGELTEEDARRTVALAAYECRTFTEALDLGAIVERGGYKISSPWHVGHWSKFDLAYQLGQDDEQRPRIAYCLHRPTVSLKPHWSALGGLKLLLETGAVALMAFAVTAFVIWADSASALAEGGGASYSSPGLSGYSAHGRSELAAIAEGTSSDWQCVIQTPCETEVESEGRELPGWKSPPVAAEITVDNRR